VAASRTSVEPPRTEVQPPPAKEGLSVQTLVIAALASGIAAVVVSHFWQRGTILFSAMTPVAVALISEALRKPVESERLRSGVRSVSSVAKPPSFARPRSGRTPNVMAPPTPSVDEGLRQREEGVEAGPVRVYSSGSNKRPKSLNGASGSGGSRFSRAHVKIAVITGLVAFLIAAAVLTLPELIFGGSVTGGGRSTTVFGGGSSSGKSDSNSKDSESNDNGSGSSSQDNQDSTSPSDSGDQPSQDSGSDQPDSSTPQDTPPSTSQNTTPAPSPTPAPTPSTPVTPTP
jgi:hypothetical protein